MKLKTGIFVIGLIVVMSVFAGAQQDTPFTGSEKITLEGGFIGNVPFPHRLHQQTIGDCKVCHLLYPQESGAVGKGKASGTIKKQQVMNRQCIACHQENKKAGKQTGPTTCNACHQKS